MDEEEYLNIVVFDSTQMRWPWLTLWWRAGGLLARATRRADVVIAAASWRSALSQVADAVRQRSTTGRPARIGLLQFWGHGVDGAMLIAGQRLDASGYAEQAGLQPLLDDVRAAIAPGRGCVWFRGCNTFRRDEGRAFARASTAFFGVPVAGHTFLIWAFHSGTHVLAPGEEPSWPPEEGVRTSRRGSVRARAATSDSVWSAPFRSHTLFALRLADPRLRRGRRP